MDISGGFLGVLFVFLGGYVSGSFSPGHIIGKKHGVDLLRVGSKSTGYTNAKRFLDKGPAMMVLALDFSKGAAIALLVLALTSDVSLAAISGAGALIGHSYSIFLQGRGGKGVSTSSGLILVLMPMVWIFVAITWFVSRKITGYTSVGSILGAMVALVLAWLVYGQDPRFYFAAFACMFVLFKHKDNIVRLLAGEEPKTTTKRA